MTPIADTPLISSLREADHVRVLFVCLGNICRSPAAEGVMRSIVTNAGDAYRWTIDSAGTGGWHVGQLPDKRMRVHAQRRGLTLDHRCRQVREADFDEFDLIIGMDDANVADLRELAPTVEAQAKVVPMARFVSMAMRADCIPDPYYEGAEGFELVLDLLEDGCRNLHRALTPEALLTD